MHIMEMASNGAFTMISLDPQEQRLEYQARCFGERGTSRKEGLVKDMEPPLISLLMLLLKMSPF